VREFKQRPHIELYGPIWIFATLIIELCILGHLTKAFELAKNDASEADIAKQTDYTIDKIFKTTFVMTLFFYG
jgi:hypothetical protein